MSFFGSDSAGGSAGPSLSEIANVAAQSNQAQSSQLDAALSFYTQLILAQSGAKPDSLVMFANTTGLAPAGHEKLGGLPANLVPRSLGAQLRVSLGGYDGGSSSQTADTFFKGKLAQFGDTLFSASGNSTLTLRAYNAGNDTYSDYPTLSLGSTVNYLTLAATADAAYAIGGTNFQGSRLRKFEPESGSWSTKADIPGGLNFRTEAIACGLRNGSLLIAGGTTSSTTPTIATAVKSASLYDPVTNTHTVLPDAPYKFYSGSACELSDGSVVLYALNMQDDSSNTMRTPLRFDFVSGAWQVLEPVTALGAGISTIGAVFPHADTQGPSFIYVSDTAAASTVRAVAYQVNQPPATQCYAVDFAKGMTIQTRNASTGYSTAAQTSLSNAGFGLASVGNLPAHIYLAEPAQKHRTAFYAVET